MNDAYVETIDILPTIFDILNINPKVKMDGHSAFSPTVRNRRTLRILQRNTFKPLRFPVADFERKKALVRERNHAALRDGRATGPARMLPDRPAPGADRPPRARGRGRGSVEIEARGDCANVNPGSDFVPTHPVGRIDGDGPGGATSPWR